MIDQIGIKRREDLREHPAAQQASSVNQMLQGVVTAVLFSDQNPTKQTLVNIRLNGGWPDLEGVPLTSTKASNKNGEEWTPEAGDGVLVSFINGHFWEPVVIGHMHGPHNIVQSDSTKTPAGKRRYHLLCNGTDIVIDKDGNRITYVAENETLTIKGNGTVVIAEGNLSIDVQTGTATITVKGDATIHTDGDLTASATGTATVTGSTVNVESDGNVSISGSGTIAASSAGNLSIESTGGTCTFTSNGTTNLVSSGNINISGTGAVNISGSNVSVSD